MAIPPRATETPNPRAIERALGRLCTHGLRTSWMLEKGRMLMGLDCVRAGLASDASEEDYARALRAYLDGAVGKIESRQHRIILEIVLGVGDEQWNNKEWRKKNAEKRRAEAGRRFRGEDGTVTYGTIRQHHEPRAIHDLAEVIRRDERDVRGEPPDEDPVDR